ncbi:hypothetical protein M569_03473, partial [Genlisea aurea]
EELDGLSHSPPRRKIHSYSQQLRPPPSSGQHNKRHQNHSLDEILISADAASCDAGAAASDEDDFYRYFGSDGNNGCDAAAVGDYYRNFRSRKEETDEQRNAPLPEFVGSGGGVGVFKVPIRAPVHPNRPPCLELRPHPLRETQGGKFLRAIASTETQLWAGLESGLRVWRYSDAYKPGVGIVNAKKSQRGDEDASPFYESTNTPPVTCMMVDEGSKLIWSGHKDGKIRSWKMDQQFSDDSAAFKEGFSFQAHRGPVLSMSLTFYGDMWSGSEGGVIRVWPWESIEKSLSLSSEERRMAALLLERSVIDLRALVTVNGVCNISSSDVKCLLSDNIRAKVWAACSLSFSLWNARTRELLKVFNIDGQIENRVDMPSSSHDHGVEDEMNVKLFSKSKKEKSQGFLQRSRNAIMGAADAVRRAAKGAGAFVEDNKKTEAIVLTSDGFIWTGCSNGSIVQWDGDGNRLHDFSHHPCAVQSFCCHGSRIWVGYSSGMIQAMDLDGNLIAGWVANNEPVVNLVIGNFYLFSLATHGGIRGWFISSPSHVDDILISELSKRANLYTRQENVRILVGTWNVGQGRASHNTLMSWLGSAVSDVDIVVVGLEEVEMGAGFLAMSAAKETVGLEGSSVGQWWQDHIGKALGEGPTFERLGSRQLAALFIAIWVRKNLRPFVGDLDVGAVARGLGRAIGNK